MYVYTISAPDTATSAATAPPPLALAVAETVGAAAAAAVMVRSGKVWKVLVSSSKVLVKF